MVTLLKILIINNKIHLEKYLEMSIIAGVRRNLKGGVSFLSRNFHANGSLRGNLLQNLSLCKSSRNDYVTSNVKRNIYYQ